MAIFAVRITSIIIAFVKNKVFGLPHTYLNKLTGMLLFLLPILPLNRSDSPWMYILCCIASVSAVEELLIILTSKLLDPNRKSLLCEILRSGSGEYTNAEE